MVYILLLSLQIIAEEITSTNHEYKLILHVQSLSILKLKIENLIVIDEIEANKLVSTQE